MVAELDRGPVSGARPALQYWSSFENPTEMATFGSTGQRQLSPPKELSGRNSGHEEFSSRLGADLILVDTGFEQEPQSVGQHCGTEITEMTCIDANPNALVEPTKKRPGALRRTLTTLCVGPASDFYEEKRFHHSDMNRACGFRARVSLRPSRVRAVVLVSLILKPIPWYKVGRRRRNI